MIKYKDDAGEDCEVSLDETGGHVMLTLRQGAHRFSQALSAQDMGRLIATAGSGMCRAQCCEGDLVLQRAPVTGRIDFSWHDEHDGTACRVSLSDPEKGVLRLACESYCARLMRTDKGA